MASTIKQRLRRYNGTDYDTIHLETQESQIVADYSKYSDSRLRKAWNFFGGSPGTDTTTWYRLIRVTTAAAGFVTITNSFYYAYPVCIAIVFHIQNKDAIAYLDKSLLKLQWCTSSSNTPVIKARIVHDESSTDYFYVDIQIRSYNQYRIDFLTLTCSAIPYYYEQPYIVDETEPDRTPINVIDISPI